MLDVISIGAATEDVFVYVPKENFSGGICVFYPGSKLDVKTMKYSTGGGAVNTSASFSKLGLRAGALCAIGNDESGARILKELRKEKVDSRLVAKILGANTGYSVILTGFGRDRVILFHAGATEMLSKAEINLRKLKAKWLYITSLHSEPIFLKKVFSHAKKIGAKVAFNPGQKEISLGRRKLGKICGKVDILLLNSREALKLTGSADVHRNLKALLDIADTVAITEGKNGAHATDGKKIYSIKAYKVKFQDATGAGDAFGSAFSAAIMKGRKTDEALVWGAANACSEIMALGTKNTVLSESGIRAFVKKHGTGENRVITERL